MAEKYSVPPVDGAVGLVTKWFRSNGFGFVQVPEFPYDFRLPWQALSKPNCRALNRGLHPKVRIWTISQEVERGKVPEIVAAEVLWE